MEHKNSMSRVERLHREKVTRYSIRKYSFGAASVAVAALFMFLGNGAVSANELSKQDTPSVEAPAKATEDKTISEEATAKPAEATTPTLDKSELTNLISEIETKLSNGSYDNKTEESVAVLKADLEAAKATLANATTQAELKKAYSKLVTTANAGLRNKPVEKKETPAVDTTNGQPTVGKKADNTEKNPESNSIENTGSKDSRNGQALDKNNAFRAETTETQGNFNYSMEYSNGKKDIYLYNEEEADVNITVSSTAGNITKATVKAGSGQFLLKSKSDQAIAFTSGRGGSMPPEEEVETDGYGWSYRQTLTETQGPVTIKITGKPNDTFKAIPSYKKTEDQEAVLGSRFLQLEDSTGDKLSGGRRASDPGYFRLVVKSQTYKYDIQPVAEENKVPVANINNLTLTDITKIKEKIKIQYSDKATTQDARLASKKGEVVDPRSSVVKEITVADGTVTVTYKDDSVDTTPVANVARVNAAPTVEIPFSVDGKKDVYVYANEDFDIPIKFKDDNGKVASATIKRGGNQESPAKNPSNPDVLDNQYNTTVEQISTETPATAENPAIVKIKGNISKDNSGIAESAFPKEPAQELTIVTRYATATDTDGAFIENTAKGNTYATDPGAFTIKLKAQTAKYDIKDPETKVTVANANNITEDEFNQIKDSIKIQYSTTNPDKNLLDKQGKDVENQTDRIESITREGNNVVVTYKDGSKDTKALADFVNVAPKVEVPYSNQTEKQVYVYTGENTDLTFKGTDEKEIKDLYLRGPGDVKENNANKYGFTTGKVENGAVTGEGSVSEDKTSATIKMAGKTNLSAGKQWTSFIVSKDNDGKLSNTDYRAIDVDPNAKEKPGYVRFVVKNQTSKYDIAAPTEKVAVADPANVTADDLDKIKEKLQIEYAQTNDDANFADKKGKTVDAADAKTKIKSVEKDNAGNLVVTYTDGSTDKKPLSDFVTLDKQPAIEAVEKAAEAQIAAINKTPNATDDEKQAAIDKVNADKTAALTAINDAATKTALDTAKDAGTTAIAGDNPVVAKKDAAKADVEAARKAKEDAIKANPNLTQAEKDAAIAKNNTAAEEATKAIDSATTNDAVDKAKEAGTGEIAKVNPVAKAAAKKAIADELAKKEEAIDGRTDLTDEEKAAAKDDAKAKAKAATDAIDAQPSNAATPEEAEKAQTAVNTAKTTGENEVRAVNPAAAKKPEAKKAVEDALKAKVDAIDARTDLTDDEKKAAKDKAAEEAKKATDAIDAATTNDAVDKAKEAGTGEIAKVNPVAKEAAKKAIADELAKKEEAIDGRTDLTDAEKAKAKEDAQAKAKAATDAINAQPDNTETPEKAAEAQTVVNGAKDKGVADVKAVNPVAKEAAKKAIADELAKKEEAINGRTDLTDEEKAAAKDDAKAKAKAATDAIDAQPSNAATPEEAATAQTAVNNAKDKGVADVKAVNPVAKEAAKKAVADELAKKEEAIDKRTDLTDEEKAAAKDDAKAKAKAATDAIDAQPSNATTPEEAEKAQTAVNGAKDKGVADVTAVNPVAAKKSAAKADVETARKAKEDAIKANPNLTQAEKDAAIAKNNTAAEEATKAIDSATTNDAVDKAKEAGTGEIAKVNPVAKEAAKKAIADELAKKEEAIDARTDLTDAEKAKAKEDAQAKAKEATDAINAQPDNAETPEKAAEAQTAVNGAKDKGVADVKAVNPVAKEAAKKAIADELAKKEEAINGRTDLTDEEKAAAKKDAQDKAKEATDAINAQPDNAATPEEAEKAQTAVNGAKDKGVADVKAVNPEAKAKPEAKKAIDEALKAKEDAIDARTDLTDDEKKAAKEAAKEEADKAKEAVDAAPSNAEVDKAKEAGTGAVEAINPEAKAKPEAKKAVDDALKAKVDAIDAREDLTPAEKQAAKDKAAEAAKKAKEAIDAATTDAAVDTAKTAGTGEIAKVNPVAKTKAKEEIAKELAKKEEAIDGRTDLTDAEKAKAKEDAQAKAKEATDAINAQPDNAETPEKAAEAQTAVNGAKDKGVADVKAVNPVAKEAAKKAIADELAKKEKAIDGRTDLTDEEKAAAKDDAKAKAKEATDAIDAQPSNAATPEEADKAQTAVNGAKDKGVADVKAVDPAAAKKPEAKKAVDDALKAKVDAIDAREDLTPAEKQAAKEKAAEEAKKAKEAIDAATTDAAVDKAKEAGTGEIAKVNPVAKEAAKKAIADELAKKEEAIDGRTDLTDEEKAAAKKDAQDKAKEATDAINAQPDSVATPEEVAKAKTAVDGAKDKGVADVKAVNPEAKAKPEAKKAIDDALKAKEAAIDARTDLTDDEKKAAKDAAKDAADKAKEAIDAAPSNAEVDKAKEAGTGAVEAINPEAKVKPEAKKAIDDALKAKEAAIDARTDLTDDEKKAAKDAAKDAADKAKEAIDAAPSDAEVDKAKEAGTGAVEAINPEAKAKPEAKKAIDDALKAKEAAIDARTDLTDDEKKAAKDAAKEAADKAKEAIDAAPSNAEVDKAKEAGTGAVEAINPEAKAKPEAKQAIDDALKAKEAAIDARTDLTDDEKKAAKEAAKEAADKAKEAIDAAPSDAEVDKAKEAGTGAVEAINPEAKAKPEAKQAIDDALKAKEAAIDARTDLTDDEKKAAKDAAKDAADKAKEAIDAAPSNAEVDKAKEAGTGEIAKVNPVAKEAAKKAVADELKAKEAEIAGRNDLTDEEKAKAKEEAQAKAKEATDAIDAQPSNAETPEKAAEAQTAVDGAKDKGVADVKAVDPEAKAKPAAKKAIEDKLAKQLEDIANTPDATDDEKKVAADAAKALAEGAKKEIDKAGTDAEVKQLQEEAEGEIEKSVPVVEDKPNARKAIEDEAKAKKEAIDARTDLTPKAKEDLKAQVDAIADQAKKSVDAAKTSEAVDGIEESDKAAIKAVGEVNIPADKVLVNNPSALTDDEKAKVLEAVKKVNPDAKEITQDADGNVTVTTPDGHKEIITPEQVVKTAATANDPKAGNDIVKPADKVVVNDPAKLTDAEKEKIKAAVEAVNPNSIVVVDDKGNAKVSTPDGQTQVIPVEELVRTVEDTKKPNAGNDIVKPADKTVVANPEKLTDTEKKAIEDKVKAVNPDATVVVDDKGNVTVTTPEGKTAVIPATDLTKDPEAATKPNAGNDIVKPADKTAVKDPANLTPEEKKAIEDKVKAVNPDATVVVDDKGNATVTTPEGKTAVIPAADLTKDSEAATKPNAGNDIVKPADKTAVKDPANLTKEEKKAIEDKVKAVNPGATVVVDDKGNATVTTPEGKTAVIPATDLTKDSEAATKPNAGNDIVKPADKTAVKDPANLTPEEKKAIEDKVKAVNPGATVVVDDKGNATVTTPEGKTAVIPATDLTKSPEDAAKPNAGNDIVKPADKVVVDPAKGVDEAAKTAIADKVKAVNPGATVVVDDKGNATVTTPEGKTAVIPATDLTKSPEDAAKANAGNAVNTPAAKVEVKDPAKLTDEEKAKVKEAIEAVNSGSKVVVDDKGNATVTTPEGDVVVIPSTDLTKSPEDAAKANAGNAVNTPAAKVEVKDPAKLTDEEKAKVKEAIEAVNPGSKVVVDDKGNATVTTSEGKTATIPAADVTKSAADAGKANAGNAVNTPAAKVEVKDPANLTDAEKKAIEDKVKAVNPGSKVVVDDKGNVTVTTPEGKTATIPAADVTKSAADAGKANAGNGANTPATKTVVKDPAKLTDEEKAKVKKAVEDVNPGSTVVVNDKGDVIVTKGDGTVLVIPELDLVIPEDKLTDPTQQNGVNTPATRVLVGDKAKLTADEIEKVKESIKAVNPGSTVVVDDKGNATVTTPEGKTATIPAAQLVKDAKDVAAKNNGENINVDFEKETVADFNNLTDAEKEAAKAKIKGANADVVEVIFDKAGNATVITKDGKVYTIVGKDIFKQRSSTDNGSSANAGQTTSGQANARKAAKELPNTGTADSTVAMVAAAASALLGLGLAGRRRKDDEEA